MIKLFTSLVLTLGVGAVAGFATAGESSGEWFTSLHKPWFQPPNWLFGPVWTLLYILMGISLYLVWKKPISEKRNAAIGIFVVQLFLNFMWSFIFFKWHKEDIALYEMVVLWILIFITILSFARFSKPAAWLLVPYISWVSFAMILNYAITKLN